MKEAALATTDVDLARLQKSRQWPAGTILFNEGDDPCGIYTIHAGHIDMLFSSRSGVTKVLRAAGPDDILGLSEAVSMTPYECTARTRTAARGGFIPLADFRRLLDENPSLWMSVARLLSADVNSCLASVRALVSR